jgi:hypothetical protein
VEACDICRGLPFASTSFDVVYHSHVLEHLTRPEAQSLMRECWRVLRPGGLIRVVVPDLEKIATDYLVALREVERVEDGEARHRYEWIQLELLDQAVRERSGGEMMAYLSQDPLPAQAWILDRCGSDVRQLIEEARRAQGPQSPARRSLRERGAAAMARVRAGAKRGILGRDYRALQVGRFRLSGEPHLWMYDRYSLASLLEGVGFQEILQRSAADSAVAGWNMFGLDTDPDGTIYKPGSLFMEARRPRGAAAAQ